MNDKVKFRKQLEGDKGGGEEERKIDEKDGEGARWHIR